MQINKITMQPSIKQETNQMQMYDMESLYNGYRWDLSNALSI